MNSPKELWSPDSLIFFLHVCYSFTNDRSDLTMRLRYSPANCVASASSSYHCPLHGLLPSASLKELVLCPNSYGRPAHNVDSHIVIDCATSVDNRWTIVQIQVDLRSREGNIYSTFILVFSSAVYYCTQARCTSLLAAVDGYDWYYGVVTALSLLLTLLNLVLHVFFSQRLSPFKMVEHYLFVM